MKFGPTSNKLWAKIYIIDVAKVTLSPFRKMRNSPAAKNKGIRARKPKSWKKRGDWYGMTLIIIAPPAREPLQTKMSDLQALANKASYIDCKPGVVGSWTVQFLREPSAVYVQLTFVPRGSELNMWVTTVFELLPRA